YRDFGPLVVSVVRDPLPLRLPVGSEVVSRVSVTYRGRLPAWLSIQDVVPEAFPLSEGIPEILAEVRAAQTVHLVYSFRPAIRGAFVLGPIVVTAIDPLGL